MRCKSFFVMLGRTWAKCTFRASASSNISRVGTRGFYLEYRLALGYAPESGDVADVTPILSLADWEKTKSTKMDACAQICRHLLADDNVPTPFAENGQLILPTYVMPEHPTRTNRIVIYQEFVSRSQILQNVRFWISNSPSSNGIYQQVLRLYGVESLNIDGKMSFEARANVVKKFCGDDANAPRVLIISMVGGHGLNLSKASAMIFLVGPVSSHLSFTSDQHP